MTIKSSSDTPPPQSTIVLPNYEMSQRATEALLDIAVHGKNILPMTIKIDGPVVMRSTTAKPRTGAT
jgi:LacI family transcriptional regulator